MGIYLNNDLEGYQYLKDEIGIYPSHEIIEHDTPPSFETLERPHGGEFYYVDDAVKDKTDNDGQRFEGNEQVNKKNAREFVYDDYGRVFDTRSVLHLSCRFNAGHEKNEKSYNIGRQVTMQQDARDKPRQAPRGAGSHGKITEAEHRGDKIIEPV